MCHSLLDALFSKTFLSHPPFKYPRSAPAFTAVFIFICYNHSIAEFIYAYSNIIKMEVTVSREYASKDFFLGKIIDYLYNY